MNILNKYYKCTYDFTIPVTACSENTKPILISTGTIIGIKSVSDKKIKLGSYETGIGYFTIEMNLQFFIEHFMLIN